MWIRFTRNIGCRRFLLLFSLLLLTCPTAMASGYDGEYTYPTGTSWGFRENVTYELSDTTLAELVQKPDGSEAVKFQRPGDLIVTVRFPMKGHREHVSTYLIHITGHSVDESAVNRESFAEEILALVNAERAKAGSNPLRLANDMMEGAAVRAEELTVKYSHTRPDGRKCFTVLKQQGRGVSENIAAGSPSPESVMHLWMNSPGHRKNILDPLYKELGVGYTYDKSTEYRHFWVQLFRR